MCLWGRTISTIIVFSIVLVNEGEGRREKEGGDVLLDFEMSRLRRISGVRRE